MKRAIKLFAVVVVLIILLVLVAITLLNALPETNIETIPPILRLPPTIIPRHYILQIQPHFLLKRFNGSVKILVKCKQETDEVVLHAKGLAFSKDITLIRTSDGDHLTISEIRYDNWQDFTVLVLSENLTIGLDYQLHLKFNGTLKHSNDRGFFAYEYKNSDKNVHYVAATSFEPIYARNAFPCFDEPHLKATFDIIIVRPKPMISLSNMPKINTESRGEWEADIYNTTMLMSTYLVCFIIGEFVNISDGKISIWAEEQDINNTVFALDISTKLLEFYEKRLGIIYDAPKLDMVLLRNVKSSGMENWGLITYSREELLYEAFENNTKKMSSVTRLVAHEIVHQWFGNLVTPEWWSHIWLSEGITTYLELCGSKMVLNKSDELENIIEAAYSDFLITNCQNIRYSSVFKEITGRYSLQSLFTWSTYEKGAMVVRMAHYIVGNDSFWKGLNHYLKKYAYKNVEEDDFWNAMNEVNPELWRRGINLSQVMKPWIHHAGIPIVTVQRNYEQGMVSFSQSSCNRQSDIWPIPIIYSTAKESDKNSGIKFWLKNQTVTVRTSAGPNDWILVNGQNNGYYFVNYDERNWKLLADLEKHTTPLTNISKRMLESNIGWLLKLEVISIDEIPEVKIFMDNEPFIYSSLSTLIGVPRKLWKVDINGLS